MADKGVIIEFDFAVAKGAELLFGCAKSLLKKNGITELDAPAEARYLAGAGYQAGLTALFQAVKTKKTAQKAARELEESFNGAISEAVPQAIGAGFRNFVKTLAERGAKVIIVTRADVEAVSPAFEQLLGDNVVLYRSTSLAYGGADSTSWRRACFENKVHYASTIAIAGSGKSVKSALVAGLGSIAIINDHVAYQDFTGADEVVKELSAPLARRVLEILRLS